MLRKYVHIDFDIDFHLLTTLAEDFALTEASYAIICILQSFPKLR